MWTKISRGATTEQSQQTYKLFHAGSWAGPAWPGYMYNIYQDSVFMIQDSVLIQLSRFKIQDSVFKIQFSRFKIQDSVSKIQDSVWFSMIQSWFKIQDSRFRIQDSAWFCPSGSEPILHQTDSVCELRISGCITFCNRDQGPIFRAGAVNNPIKNGYLTFWIRIPFFPRSEKKGYPY